MSSILDKVAERLKELNSGGSNKMDYAKVKDGRNVFRILPGATEDIFFAEEAFVHYGIGKDGNNKGLTAICPTSRGDHHKCPICEHSKKLRSLSHAKDDEYDKLARELSRKKRVYFNVIDRSLDLSQFKFEDGKWKNIGTGEDLPQSPVQILSTGISVYKSILSIMTDPEYGDITHPTEGLDVIITKSGSGFTTEYDVKTVRKESPIGLEHWQEGLTDLSVLSKAKPYDELKAMLEGDTRGDSTEYHNTVSNNTEPVGDSNIEAPSHDDIDAEIQRALAARQNNK